MTSEPTRSNYDSLPRYPLTVCASLLTNPENMGQLCRTVEAFRLQELVIADAAIAQTPSFRRLAVSSQRWQPLQICPVNALGDWLARSQAEGYTCIALDANPKATCITQFVYPLKSIVLLGRELTGIPTELLDQCDLTLTIPQFGLVQSLNVQTAAAIAIYEYIRQHHATLDHAAYRLRHPG
jgi:tRNA G18 (ribose-2'-O)-methylase SpoU